MSNRMKLKKPKVAQHQPDQTRNGYTGTYHVNGGVNQAFTVSIIAQLQRLGIYGKARMVKLDEHGNVAWWSDKG